MMNYQCGDLIWAKMKGFSPWPGQIVEPLENVKRPAIKKPLQSVYFFGTGDYAWIEEAYIRPFFGSKAKLSASNRTSKFKEAVAAIEEYIKENQEVTDEQKKREADSSAKTSKGESESSSSAKTSKAAESQKRRDSETATSSKAKKATGTPKKNEITTEKPSKSSTKPAPKRKRKQQDRDSLHEENKENKTKKARLDVDDLEIKPRAKPALNFISRPSPPPRPETPPIDMESLSQSIAGKSIVPSDMKFGFIGLGTMGKGIARNLIASKHKVVVWNRSPDKCREFVDAGAEEVMTPSDVISSCDITFSCVSDSKVAKDILFGNCGVLEEIKPGKGYVEMTTMDSDTAQDDAEAVSHKGGRYLQAQIQGTRKNSNDGSLVLIAAGDKSLFHDCQSCFEAVGNHSFYVGEVGSASKINLILQLMHGVTIGALAEGLALADRAGLEKKDVLELLSLCAFCSPVMLDKGKSMIEGKHDKAMALSHMQKDLKLVLEMSEQLEQPIPITATANEVFKYSKRAGYHDHDVSAVFIRTRF